MIYFDNAATTQLDNRVLEMMLPYFNIHYGNPSAIHRSGRESRLAIEEARKKVAHLLNCKPADIFFTSCGTESTNTILNAAVRVLGCENIITSPIEHHATLYAAEKLCGEFGTQLHFTKHDADGIIDYAHLKQIIDTCAAQGKTLVSIMHANNEIGIVNDIEKVGTLCQASNVYFHTDMVQTIGHMAIDFSKLSVDFASASAHKFHGPKGNGFMYINTKNKLQPLLLGGGQERNMRAGTENVAGIVGLAEALELAIGEQDTENKHCLSLKKYCLDQLEKTGVDFSLSSSATTSLPRVLSILLPQNDKTEMLQMSLDIKGIAVSGGSACSSGALGGSHVINALQTESCVPMRISFCKWNTKEEVDVLISSLLEILR